MLYVIGFEYPQCIVCTTGHYQFRIGPVAAEDFVFVS